MIWQMKWQSGAGFLESLRRSVAVDPDPPSTIAWLARLAGPGRIMARPGNWSMLLEGGVVYERIGRSDYCYLHTSGKRPGERWCAWVMPRELVGIAEGQNAPADGGGR